MSGIISDTELDAFDDEEMKRHYKDGYCEARGFCKYCQTLEYERQYWEDFENEEMRRICKDELKELC